jgi:thiamine-monophosphate kinase
VPEERTIYSRYADPVGPATGWRSAWQGDMVGWAPVQVDGIGEFALIARLARRLEAQRDRSPSVVQGIGDDAAIWRPTAGWLSVTTTDTMIEGVHFTADTTPWRDLGWKSLAVNVSDLAAMAAEPRVALVTLALTGVEDVADIDALYDGITDAALAYGVQVIGGDTVRAPHRHIGFAITGEVPEEGGSAQVLRRDAALPGDVLAVTGHPGDAAAGLDLLLRGAGSAGPPLVSAHRRPRPRVREARWLFEQGVRCATDSSDSLCQEVELLCAASNTAAWIDAASLPLSSALLAAFPERCQELALYGGEDYELVLAVRPEGFSSLQAAWQARFSVPLSAIGGFGPALPDGTRVEVRGYRGPRSTFQHFSVPA